MDGFRSRHVTLSCPGVSAKSERSTQLATSSSIALVFEELNDEGSHTTVFRAWNNVSTSLHDQTTHSQSIWEARIWIYYYIMHCIFQKLAQCAPFSGYEENTKRAWSVTLLAPDA